LANIGPMDVELKYRALQVLKEGWGPFSYDPTKLTAPDTFNAQLELFGAAEPTSLDQIRRRIIALSRRGDEEATANLEVTECLHKYAVDNNVRAKRYDISPYNLSGAVGIHYSFWLPLVLVVDDRLMIPFIDPRRTRGLSAIGRRFTFSMAHHRARVLYPDLADAELAIFAFPVMTDPYRGECRRLRTYLAGGGSLFSYEELDRMVAETYQIWEQVLAERRDEARRAGVGRRGSLL
jgi:hypothetical protein